MNLESIFFWIRLLLQAILDVLEAVEEEQEDGPQRGSHRAAGGTSGFKPERIQVWLRILAQAGLEAIDEVVVPPGENRSSFAAGSGNKFKPERIQFWLRLIARFVLAVLDGVGEETGKSGEHGAAAPDAQEAGW